MTPQALKILLVSDDDTEIEAIRRALGAGGQNFELQVKRSVSEVVQLTLRGFDIVLADDRLPDGTAFDILKVAGSNQPIIMLSGSGSEEIVASAAKFGFYDCLIKDAHGDYVKQLPQAISRAAYRLPQEWGGSAKKFYCNILYVEDDEIDRKALSRGLKNRNFPAEITCAASVADAVRLLREKQYDVVLIDYLLGANTALDLIPSIRDTPFIVITGMGDEEIALACMRKGADDYVVKDPRGEYISMLPPLLEKTLIRKRDTARENFVNIISHEMRTPLAIQKEVVESLLDGLAGPLNTEQREMLGISKNSVDRLSSIIDNMLDLARLESGRVTRQPVELRTVPYLEKTVRDLRDLVQKKGLELKTAWPDNLPPIYADGDLLSQVFVNLIMNASRFAKKRIHITAALDEQKNMVCFSIHDDGEGISELDRTRIFDKFVQANRPRGGSGYQGIGLGLYICKMIVQQHRGDIWVENDSGATFSFTIPCYDPEKHFLEALYLACFLAERDRSPLFVILLSPAEEWRQKHNAEATGTLLEALRDFVVNRKLVSFSDPVLRHDNQSLGLIVRRKEDKAKLKRELREALAKAEDAEIAGVPLGIGIASYPQDGRWAKELIETAQREMHAVVHEAVMV